MARLLLPDAPVMTEDDEQERWVAPRLRPLKTRVITKSQLDAGYETSSGQTRRFVVVAYVVLDPDDVDQA